MEDINLKRGDRGEKVRRLQLYICRLSASFSCIPKIGKIDGYYGEKTANGVWAFQCLYAIPADGAADGFTYRKIEEVFSFFQRLEQLYSACRGVPKQYRRELSVGSRGADVVAVQYFLALVSEFSDLPKVKTDGIYGEQTARAVAFFQREKGLTVTAEVDGATWDKLYLCSSSVTEFLLSRRAIPETKGPVVADILLGRGNVGPPVRNLKLCLKALCEAMGMAASFDINNAFDIKTQSALQEFQRIFAIAPSGKTDAKTVSLINQIYRIMSVGSRRLSFQFPGNALRVGCRDAGAVSDLQKALHRLSGRCGFPPVYPDGVFGDETAQAVGFFGADEVDFRLWWRIMEESGYLSLS